MARTERRNNESTEVHNMDMNEMVEMAVNDPELNDMTEEEIRVAFAAFEDPVTTILTLLEKQESGVELTEQEDGAVYSASLLLLVRALMKQGIGMDEATDVLAAYEDLDEATGGTGIPNVYADPATGAVFVGIGPIHAVALNKDATVTPDEVLEKFGLETTNGGYLRPVHEEDEEE